MRLPVRQSLTRVVIGLTPAVRIFDRVRSLTNIGCPDAKVALGNQLAFMKEAAEALLTYETPISLLKDVRKEVQSLRTDLRELDKLINEFDEMVETVRFLTLPVCYRLLISIRMLL